MPGIFSRTSDVTWFIENIFDELKEIFDDIISQNETQFNSISQQGKLCFGDVICVERSFYYHYGIYCNHKSVIHFSSLDSDISFDNEIIETDLNTFRRDGNIIKKLIFPTSYGVPNMIDTYCAVRKNELMDILKFFKSLQYHLYSPEETVERARSKIGQKNYNLFFNNCEHFAIWCKTGIHESHQINRLLESPLVVLDHLA